MNKEIKQGYKQTKVGIIPQDWEVFYFDEIFIFSTGKNIKQNEASPDFEIPCVRYGELYHLYNEIITKVINKTNLDKSELLFSKGDEILLPSAGEDPLDIGSASALTLKNIAIGRTINILRPSKKNIYSQKYIAYYINHQLKTKIASLSKGSSISNVYNSDLKKLKIPLPPLKEQEKIAEILTTWDEAITKQTELLRAKELQKKGLIQKLLSGEVRFRGFSDEWEDIRLGQLPLIVSDGNYGEMYPKSEDFKDLGVPFLRANNIKNLSIDSSDTKYISNEQHLLLTSGHLRTNDILITTRGDIGNIALVDSRFENANINAQICLIRIRDNSKVYYRFLLYFLDSVYCKSQYKELETGSALKQLPKGNLAKLKIKLPSLPEQQKIAEVLSLADDEINLLKNELEKLNLQKKALMQKLLTGQVRVKV